MCQYCKRNEELNENLQRENILLRKENNRLGKRLIEVRVKEHNEAVERNNDLQDQYAIAQQRGLC